jgi:hypothetical protein
MKPSLHYDNFFVSDFAEYQLAFVKLNCSGGEMRDSMVWKDFLNFHSIYEFVETRAEYQRNLRVCKTVG